MISNRAIAGRAAALVLFLMSALAALARGGVSLRAQSLACAGAAVALGLAAIHDRRNARRGRTPKFPLLAWAPLLVFAMTSLQCLPIPSLLLRLLAPVNAQLRFFPPAPAASFAPITLDLPATASQLAPAFAIVVSLLAASLLARRPRTQLLLLCAPIAAALLQVGICFVRLAGQGTLAGSFVNRNHLAALLMLGALAALGAALSPPREEEPGTLPQLATTRPLWIASAVACAACTLLTLSRGAAVALGIGALALVALERSSQEKSRRRTLRLFWVTLPLAGAIAAALLVATTPLTARFAQLASQPISADTKLRSFLGAAEVALEHPLLGVGRGAWRYLAERHRSVPGEIAFVYVENEPLQLAAEEGLPLALAIVAFAIIGWLRAAKAARSGLARGVLAGALAVALQNLVDFNLEFIGVALPLAVAVGAALADAHGPHTSPDEPVAKKSPELRGWIRIPRPLLFFAALAGLLLAPLPIVLAPLSAEREAARLVFEARNPATSAEQLLADAEATVARHPADWLVSLAPAIGLHQRAPRRTAEALAWAGRAQMLGPKSWRPHLVAALIFLRANRAAQARVETRLALENLGDVAYSEPLELPGETCATLDELLEATPDDPLQRAQVATHLRMQHHPALARLLVVYELSLPETSRAAPAKEALQLELATILLDAKEFSAAEPIIAQLPETLCRRAILLAETRRALGRSAAAIEEPLLAARTHCPREEQVYELLFHARLARADLAGAAELLEDPWLADSTLPFASQVHRWRAELLEAKREPAQALHERWLAALVAPDNSDPALDYAERLRSQGDLAGAIVALQSLSLRASGDARAHLDSRLAELEKLRAEQRPQENLPAAKSLLPQ